MTRVRQAVIVSDIHAGCKFALCPPGGVSLDHGGRYKPSRSQEKLHEFWQHGWDTWVPQVTRGEPYAVVCNGDILDGVHHRANTQITHNMEDQRSIAYEILAPIRDRAAKLYMVRGTEAHVGQGAQDEEAVAKRLDAVRDEHGHYSRYELWMQLGTALVHCSHHIGTTGSMAYETSAPMRELAELLGDSARWGNTPPDVVVRSHRHRHVQIQIPTRQIYAICFTTAAWQLRTPFAYKVPGGRVATPHIGMSLVRCGDEEVYTRHYVQTIPRNKVAHPRVVEKP